MVLEYTIKKTQINTRSTLQYKSLHLVGYADDVNIMRRSIQRVKEGIEALENSGKEVGLKINREKLP